MKKAACDLRSSAREGILLTSPNQTQALSALNRCSTSVEHNPSNVNTPPDPDPESGPGKKVKFKQEEVEEEGTPTNLQPPSNLASTTAQVRNVDISHQKLNTRLYISKKYQALMCELVNCTADISKSLDHTVLTSSCYVCDPRIKPLVNEVESLETNKQLAQNISFKISDGFQPSHWQYDQLFNGKFAYLPSGEFEAKKRTLRLLERLNKEGNAVPRCATEKLQQLYCEKGLSWLTGFDMTNKVIFFSPTLALKDAGSTSSARVCSATNCVTQLMLYTGDKLSSPIFPL